MYKRLFILIEGPDDGNFFHRIIKPIFEQTYDHVQLWEHADKSPKSTRSFISNISAMSADYIFITDINDAPCITFRKQAKQSKLKNLDQDKIIVVIKEIESWYLAGLDDACSKKCGIRPCNTTDTIIKEQFNNMTPRKFNSSRVDFLQEILKYFQVETAKQKNESFRYFLEDFFEKYASGYLYARNL